MHKEGFTGAGIKVAIVDTGVDYTHEALGGCFGPGCCVAFGDNFAEDGKKGDPIDCHGHGTFLAGFLGGKSLNYTGAAPSATLMAYQVYDCNRTTSVDRIMSGWLKAAEEGAHVIVSAVGYQTGRSQEVLARTVARTAASGVVCVNSIGNSPEKGPYRAAEPSAARGVISVSSSDRDIIGDELATYGPLWDLDIRPSLAAPGVDVPFLTMHNDSSYYSIGASTSYAAGIAAGATAIVVQSLGGGSNGTGTFNLTEVRGRLMSTAKPKLAYGKNGIASVIKQGGGLTNAWDAAHTTTIVDPPSLALNDTDHRVASISLRITNKANSEVTYQLSSQHATTLYAPEPRPFEPNPISTKAVNGKADIKISKNSLVLGPGASESIEVTATDPSGLDLRRLPIWSGWVIVNGTDGTSLSIPYLGLAGSLRSAATIYPSSTVLKIPDPNGESNYPSTDGFVLNDPQNGQKPGPSNSVKQKDAGESVDKTALRHSPAHTSLVISRFQAPEHVSNRPDLSQACVPNEIITEFAGTKSIGQLQGSPLLFVDRQDGSESLAHWDGSFAPGQYAPPGRYQFALHALALFGNPDNESHWQTSLTNEFSIAYKHNIKP